jgi:hypothetical protein
MVTTELYMALEKIANSKAGRRAPYYIQVQIDDDYRGPAAVSKVVSGKPVHAEKTADVNSENKRIIHTRLVCMEQPPIVPMLGTLLFKMDNRKGQMELIYALPADIPHSGADSDNFGEVSTAVARSAQKLQIPMFYQ